MHLYILEPREADDWPPHDANMHIIVRAPDARTARRIAQENTSGDENLVYDKPWLNAGYTTCKPLKPEGPEGLILANFNPG